MQTCYSDYGKGRLHRTIGFWVISAATLIAACSGPGLFRSPPPPETENLTAFHETWKSYAGEVNGIALQSDCMPRFVPAENGRERRGAVIMFHGFSGCPQQFFTMAERVAAHGYDVLLPLHPGHGLQPNEDNSDDLTRLPQTDEEQNHYAVFAARMNVIMALSPGEKIAVGFSLGGAVALNASLAAPDLYDRLLLLSPLLAIRGGALIEDFAGLLGQTPGFRNITVKTPKSRARCDDWQASGRAGFCDYRYRDLVALLGLEDINQILYGEQPPNSSIQIITAGAEKYVSNRRIIEFTERHREHGPIALCALPDDVPHEMLSPYENAGRQMYWLGELLAGSVEFIINGQFYPPEITGDEQKRPIPACRHHRLKPAIN